MSNGRRQWEMMWIVLAGCVPPSVEVASIGEALAPGLFATLHRQDEPKTTAWLVLPGASGPWPDYDTLAARWSVEADVLVLDYYDGGADLEPGRVLNPSRENWEGWVENSREAVRWLRREHGATCVGTVGMSRGGTLAYTLGIDGSVDATVLVHAVPRSDHRREREADVLARLDQRGPVLHVTGRDDGLLDPEEAMMWHEALHLRDVDATLRILDGGPHGYMLQSFPETYDAVAAEETSDLLVAFLGHHCPSSEP